MINHKFVNIYLFINISTSIKCVILDRLHFVLFFIRILLRLFCYGRRSFYLIRRVELCQSSRILLINEILFFYTAFALIFRFVDARLMFFPVTRYIPLVL
jgi:hypothetical protein